MSPTGTSGAAGHGYDAVDDASDASDGDGHGHGTHVATTAAGSAYGVAKEADVLGVRVLNDQGSGTTAQVVAGIDWVTRNAEGPAVANMSLGGGADEALDAAVRNSVAGVTYAVAAGNSSSDAGNYSPARVGEAITVGATDSDDGRAYYSNYGSAVDIFAPGSSITGGWNTSDTATPADNPDASAEAVGSALVDGATDGVVGDPGSGSPNRLLRVLE